MSRRRALALLVAPFLAGGLLASPAVADAVWTKTTFNSSHGGTQIVDHLVQLIDAAENGSSIQVAQYRLEDEQVTDALADAVQDRGVDVEVVVDHGTVDDANYAELAKVLEDDEGSWAKDCGSTEYACIGENAMHNKFFLFSSTQGASNVVATGSANLSGDTLGGTGGWNSYVTQAGNVPIYERYQKYFADLAEAQQNPDYYGDNPPVTSGSLKSYLYPRGADQGDTTVNTLDSVDCAAEDTAIRIAMWSISRTELSDALREKARAGCAVDIVADRISADACAALTESGGDPVSIRGFDDQEHGVHEKNMMIEGHYVDPGAKAVFTGSANFNYLSLNHNDENVLRISDPAVHDAFVANFQQVKDAADITVDSSDDCSQIDPEVV